MTEAEAVATSTSAVSQDIQQVAPRLDTVSFAVALPSSVYTGWDEPDTALPVDDKGIVGTIVFLKNSVMVWFGWGQLQPAANVAVSAGSDTTATTRSVGQATHLNMGPLIVAMPRTKYQGAFCEAEACTSKLIGCEGEDDEMIARQMSSRLSQRLGMSVLVSCSFAGAPAMAQQGVDAGAIQHRAAALAEREIGRLLREATQRESSA